MSLLIETSRLKLLPFTKKICEETLINSVEALKSINIIPCEGWPDLETLNTLPRILVNLNKAEQPSGFESWMIIEKNSNYLIGDIGFKGIPNDNGEIDLGYGIIANKRRSGFAIEAASCLLAWAFAQLKVKVVTANCHSDNLGSKRILSLLNFRLIKQDNDMIYWKQANSHFITQ